MITKKYPNGKITIDAGAFPHMAQEAIDSAVFNCTPVREAVKRLRQLEENEKHGHWIITEYEYYDCSNCGNSYFSGCRSLNEAKERLENNEVYPYCPFCGALMRED